MRYLAIIKITLPHKVITTHTITYDNGFNTYKNLYTHISDNFTDQISIKISFKPTEDNIYLVEQELRHYEEGQLFQKYNVSKLLYSKKYPTDLEDSKTIQEGKITTCFSKGKIISNIPISSLFLFHNNLNQKNDSERINYKRN